MPVKKMRVEIFDGGGNRYTITFEGNVTREKALRLFDLIELLGGIPGGNPNPKEQSSPSSKFDKLRLLLEKHFPIVWFSSKDAQVVYEREFKEPISLSTVSTYLSRMTERGILTKSNTPSGKYYRLRMRVSPSIVGSS
jgi:hypothetical protein